MVYNIFKIIVLISYYAFIILLIGSRAPHLKCLSFMIPFFIMRFLTTLGICEITYKLKLECLNLIFAILSRVATHSVERSGLEEDAVSMNFAVDPPRRTRWLLRNLRLNSCSSAVDIKIMCKSVYLEH